MGSAMNSHFCKEGASQQYSGFQDLNLQKGSGNHQSGNNSNSSNRTANCRDQLSAWKTTALLDQLNTVGLLERNLNPPEQLFLDTETGDVFQKTQKNVLEQKQRYQQLSRSGVSAGSTLKPRPHLDEDRYQLPGPSGDHASGTGGRGQKRARDIFDTNLPPGAKRGRASSSSSIPLGDDGSSGD